MTALADDENTRLLVLDRLDTGPDRPGSPAHPARPSFAPALLADELAISASGEAGSERRDGMPAVMHGVDGEHGEATIAPLVRPGRLRIVAGRYVLGEPVGRGGMGRVYRAHDRLLDRDVALKLLYADAVHDRELGRACATEARAAGRLAHDGVARVFDAGIDDGCLFIVMELVRGETLASRLVDGARPRMRDAVGLVAQVADALDHAHACGVVHCDVKPANILVTPEGRTKLVDFGIAHAATVTGTLSLGELRGSAPYISPEQVRGGPVDGRSDLYALGAVLFELLTGHPPFDGANVAAVMACRLVNDPPSPRALNPAVPSALDRIVRKALAREPAQRYQAAADFAAELWSVLPRLPERDEPPPSVAARVRSLAMSSGNWAVGRSCALSCSLDRAGAGLHVRSSRGALARVEPAIVERASLTYAAVARGPAGHLGAAAGNGLGARLAAFSRALDRAGSGLHERPPRARLAAGREELRARAGASRAGLQARAQATRVRLVAWAMLTAAALARAAAQARSASVRAGLAVRVAVLTSLALLARWTVASGRQARRLGRASVRQARLLGCASGRCARQLGYAGGARAGTMLAASLAAASRGLDRAGARLQAHPPRTVLAAGRTAVVTRARTVGSRTANCLVVAADALDRAEPLVRAAYERAHDAARRRDRSRPDRGWLFGVGDRPFARCGFEAWLARRSGVEQVAEVSKGGTSPTLAELEADLVRAYPSLDVAVVPAGAPEELHSWSESPTLTRAKGR